LVPRGKPYFQTISPNIALGYRRNTGAAAGTWSVRASDGHGGNWLERFAVTDDHEESNGETVLTFWEAQDKARSIARADEGTGERPATVGEAVDAYEAALLARGDVGNARRVRCNLPSTLAARPVALLTSKELRSWRDRLVKDGLTPSTADRTASAFKAALNLAKKNVSRVISPSTSTTRSPEASRAAAIASSRFRIATAYPRTLSL
jgi:hypothetical protein